MPAIPTLRHQSLWCALAFAGPGVYVASAVLGARVPAVLTDVGSGPPTWLEADMLWLDASGAARQVRATDEARDVLAGPHDRAVERATGAWGVEGGVVSVTFTFS